MENEIKNEVQNEEVTEIDRLRDALETAIRSRNSAENALRITEERFIACTTDGVYIPFEIFDTINNFDDRDLGNIMGSLMHYCDDYSKGVSVDAEKFMDPEDDCFAFYSLLTKMIL